MESRLDFATQKDFTHDGGVHVRYSSEPRVEINERMEPKNHPRVLVPKRANVIRMVTSWKRRYPTIPVLMRKRDVKGTFKLLHVAIRGLTHMGVKFSTYMVLYPSLYFGWKPSPASRKIIPALLFLFVSSFIPIRPRGMGPEGFVAYEYLDDAEFAEPWVDIRPRKSARIWEYASQSCLGAKALHWKKRQEEVDCATSMVLWGLNVSAKSDAISSHLDKCNRPRSSCRVHASAHG